METYSVYQKFEFISTFEDPEKIRIIFYDEDLFRERDHGIPVNGGPDPRLNEVLFDILPEQLPPKTAGQIAAEAAIETGAQSSTIIFFLLNLTLSASLNQLWSMINTQ